MGIARVCLLAAAAAAMLPAPARASADLARQQLCTACHHVERKLVGPSFRDIARRYAASYAQAEQATVDSLAASIRAGGANKWGPVAMPAQPRLAPADARALAVWVLKGAP